MTLVRWEPLSVRNPWHGLMRVQRQMNRLFDDFEGEDETPMATYAPRMNVTDMEDHIEVTAELPGMNRDQVKIEINNNVLTISGEKLDEHEKKDRNLYISERVFGQFHRSFQLPSQVDVSKIEAAFNGGILNVSLPKVEEAKPKQIEIKVK
mgnify:CR=1 FL=1